MLSKNLVKDITALHHKKFRREENLFIAEGEKVVRDLLESGLKIIAVYGTQEYFQNISNGIRIPGEIEMVLISEDELRKISLLTSPQRVLAVAEIPATKMKLDFQKGLKLVLDTISDPGNFGTVIRIADWFGIDDIYCSENSADCYNPKVVQSAMGALFRRRIYYTDLMEMFEDNLSENEFPVYATVLDGKNIYEEKLVDDCFLIIGNESSGISDMLLPFITKRITIPSYGETKSDSLNVAVATGIVCAEFRKR